MQEYEQSVFISYARNGGQEEIVEQLDMALQKRGIKLVRDKRDLSYKGSIRDFMERIGRGSCVIVIVSDAYLRSHSCMFELVEIFRNRNFYDRVFPVVLQDADIYDPVNRIQYVKHWEDKESALDQAMKTVSSSNLQGVREEIDSYNEIRANIANLTFVLKNMNTLTSEMHRNSDFSALYDALEKRLKEAPAADEERRAAESKPTTEIKAVNNSASVGSINVGGNVSGNITIGK